MIVLYRFDNGLEKNLDFTDWKFNSTAKSAIILLLAGTISGASSDLLAVGVDGAIRFQNNRMFGTEIGDIEGNHYYSGFDLNYHDRRNRSLKKTFEFSSRITDADEFIYSISEANIEKNFKLSNGNHHSVFAGRKVLRWNDLDQIWGLGVLNNRQNFTFYDPGQEGLAGLGYSLKAANGFKVSLFASYVYIPELNPGLEVEDGKAIGKSPWANVPPATYEVVDGELVDMRYTIQMPGMSETVFRYTGGFKFGFETDYWDINAFYMRKPENQPRIIAYANMYTPLTSPTGEKYIEADIIPEFMYENIVGGDAALNIADYQLTVSGLMIIPDQLQFSNDPTFETKRFRKTYGGVGITKANSSISLGAHYLRLLSIEGDPNDDKQKFINALNLNLNALLYKRFSIGFDYKYDFSSLDQVIQNELAFRIEKNITISAGYKLIAAPNDKSFWAGFRDRDMAYTNLTYFY